MDLIEKVSGTVAEKRKQAVGKAKEIAEIAALKNQVAACEEVIQKNYLEIGKLFVEMHQDAEDAVSECVLSAWKQIPGLRQPGAFGGWIFRILSGCCAGYIKTQIQRKGEVDLEAADAKDQRSSQIDDMILREALSKLSEEERNIVLLSVVSGLTSKEISESTGLTPGAVRSKLSRSLGKLRGYLS